MLNFCCRSWYGTERKKKKTFYASYCVKPLETSLNVKISVRKGSIILLTQAISQILAQDLFKKVWEYWSIKITVTSTLKSILKEGFKSTFLNLHRQTQKRIIARRNYFKIILNGYVFEILISEIIWWVLEINGRTLNFYLCWLALFTLFFYFLHPIELNILPTIRKFLDNFSK